MKAGNETLLLCSYRNKFLVLSGSGRVLQLMLTPPFRAHREVVDSIRILAGMDIALTAPLQEGSFMLGAQGEAPARPLNVACIPDPYGELRLVLGFSPASEDYHELLMDFMNSHPFEEDEDSGSDSLAIALFVKKELMRIIPRPEGIEMPTSCSIISFNPPVFPDPFTK